MKFTWFNLMPWPHLPADFRKKHRSVWVDIDAKLYDPVKGHDVYNQYLDMLDKKSGGACVWRRLDEAVAGSA